LVRLLLHTNPSSCLNDFIDCSGGNLSERAATTARMSNRRMEANTVNLALQVNLKYFSIRCCSRKVIGASFMDEQMQDDSIKRWILRVSVSLPVGNVHIEFDISFKEWLPVDS
jgi:hypothetical protein